MKISYFSLEKIPNRSDCEKLLKEYKIQNKIGAHDKVYSACKNENCNFVLKTIEFCKSKYRETDASKVWKKRNKKPLANY